MRDRVQLPSKPSRKMNLGASKAPRPFDQVKVAARNWQAGKERSCFGTKLAGDPAARRSRAGSRLAPIDARFRRIRPGLPL